MFSRRFPDEVTRRRAIEQAVLDLGDLTGRLCVYVEGGSVHLVRVAAVGISGWGLRFIVKVVPTPGFEPEEKPRFEASAAWDIVSVSERAVRTGIWNLLTRYDLVQDVVSAAAQGQTGDDLALHVYNLAPELQALARPATQVMSILPLVMGAQALLRGRLIRGGCTGVVRTAMGLNVLTLGATLLLGTAVWSLPGVTLAAVATLAGQLVELAWLRAKATCF